MQGTGGGYGSSSRWYFIMVPDPGRYPEYLTELPPEVIRKISIAQLHY
jgi:hypothetical protein